MTAREQAFIKDLSELLARHEITVESHDDYDNDGGCTGSHTTLVRYDDIYLRGDEALLEAMELKQSHE